MGTAIIKETMDTQRKNKMGRFNPIETLALQRNFAKITDHGRMDRSQFRDILHSTFDMNDDSLMDRMFRTFNGDADGYLTFKEWLRGLWIFLRGSLNEKALYCFEVYDIDGDGVLSKGDMFQLLKSSLRQAATKVLASRNSERTPTPSPRPQTTEAKIDDEEGTKLRRDERPPVSTVSNNAEEDPDEGARDLAELALSLLDKDKDGVVSQTDFLTSVQEDILLLEILGPCLPSTARVTAILAALNANESVFTTHQDVDV